MLEGRILYYDRETGLSSGYDIGPIEATTLKAAISEMMEKAKANNPGAFKQIFIQDTDLKKTVFYKSNFE